MINIIYKIMKWLLINIIDVKNTNYHSSQVAKCLRYKMKKITNETLEAEASRECIGYYFPKT